ncbi:hypothetical protein [Loktanella sp. Alg231-35]|uniref:hypothetical protein n=1 Tax=Loktanella sp. Alg231-35 TaxID=1922220 RepID=UPI000D560418|nr:hypothetical protein [Loktanella sp. Alg231-35]
MRSYDTARGVFSFLGFCAAALIGLGVIVAFLGGFATQSLGRNAGALQFFLGAMPGIMMAAVGVVGQCMVQMGRASVDTAEYAQQSLKVSRQHMELSQQLLEQGKTTAASFASLNLQHVAQTSGPASGGADAGASYADQPATAMASVPDQGAPAALPAAAATAAPSTKAITHEEQVPLPPLSSDITYKDGKFAVGDRQFATKGEALAYQQSLVPVASK